MKDLTGIVLAGGKSTRMGQEKGLVSFRGKALIQHAITCLENLSIPILIVANEPAYQQFKHPVFPDLYLQKGPLGGIYTGLMHSKTEKNIILSCDTPFVPSDLLCHLVEQSHSHPITLATFNTEPQPLIGVYKKALLPNFKAFLDQNQLKMRYICEELAAQNIELAGHEKWGQPHFFFNINSPDELKQLENTMTIKVNYYGMLAEIVGKTSEELDFPLSDQGLLLKPYFETKYPKLHEMNYKIAVNQQFTEELDTKRNVSEIALMPPFAGG